MAVVAMLASSALAGPPSAERQAELIYLLQQDCGSCHGLTLKGGLGPPLLPGPLAGRDEEEIAEAILHGRPGMPMPPWEVEISRDEALWLARLLKRGLDHGR